MAIESFYLRKKIKYHLTTLCKYLELEDIPETHDESVDEYYSNVEIKIIEICLLTRKLEDLGKLPDDALKNAKIKVKKYESKGLEEQRAYVDFEKEYDLDDCKDETISLRDVCNMVTHSYILQATGNETHAFSDILVTSDNTQFKGLYLISTPELIAACREVVDLYPNHVQSTYDTKLHKWVHTRAVKERDTGH